MLGTAGKRGITGELGSSAELALRVLAFVRAG
jgi:hypothetical protein